MPLATIRLNLDNIILSEVSQGNKIIIHYHLCVESKKITQINLYTERNRLTGIENKLTVTKGEREGVKLGVWD